MIPSCCVGCKHAIKNQCQKNYCWIYRLFRLFNREYFVHRVNDCGDCSKHGTMECPNSFLCYATDEKPHYERSVNRNDR